MDDQAPPGEGEPPRKADKEARIKPIWSYLRQRDLTRVLFLLIALVAVVVGARHCGRSIGGVFEQLDREGAPEAR